MNLNSRYNAIKIEEHFSKTHSVQCLLLRLSEFWKSAPQLCWVSDERVGVRLIVVGNVLEKCPGEMC